jgi:hypothetical protein
VSERSDNSGRDTTLRERPRPTRRDAGATVAQALATAPCPIPLAAQNQGEALDLARDGSGDDSASENSGTRPTNPVPRGGERVVVAPCAELRAA